MRVQFAYYDVITGIRANFFSRGGAEPSLPKKYFESARKNCYANLQNCFARLTPPNRLRVTKIPDFGHFMSLDRLNSVFSFNKYFFSFLAAGFYPKNVSFV